MMTIRKKNILSGEERTYHVHIYPVIVIDISENVGFCMSIMLIMNMCDWEMQTVPHTLDEGVFLFNRWSMPRCAVCTTLYMHL